MSGPRYQIDLSQAELIGLYLVLSRREADLDDVQTIVLERVAATLYGQLSVSEMEGIDSYYEAIVGPRSGREAL
jgi:hypothetical protein